MFDNKTKYIVVKNEFGNDVMIVFPNSLIHRDVARGFRGVSSAGFVTFYPEEGPAGEFHCSGRSESLDLDSNPERDNKLANKLLYPV